MGIFLKGRCRQRGGAHDRLPPRHFTFLLIVVLSLASLSPPAAAQSDGDVLDLPHAWQVGDTQHLILTKSIKQYVNGDMLTSRGVRIPVTAEVIEKRADGYTLRWTFGKTEALGANTKQNRILNGIDKILDSHKLDLITDGYGRVTDLANAEEILEVVRQYIGEELNRDIDELTPSAEVAAKVRASLEPITAPLLSKDSLEAIVLNGPRFFYRLGGGSYRRGVTYPFEEPMHNSFGGAPVPSNITVVLTDVDPAGTRAELEWRQSIDTEVLLATVREALTAKAKKDGAPLPNFDDVPEPDIESFGTYELDTDRGWPVAFDYESRATFGRGSMIERLTIESVPD